MDSEHRSKHSAKLDIDGDFFRLAERHSEAVANINALQQSLMREVNDDVKRSLAKAVALGNDMRAALIEWKPRSNAEAQSKLLYLAQYLFATMSSLSDQEMAVIMDSIAHLRRTRRPSR
jgi:phage gpG-like protein